MRVDYSQDSDQAVYKMAFVKGKSGNPGGRPKVDAAFKDRARVLADKHVLALWIREIENDGENAMKASELLAAYAYGKPTQAVDVSGEMTNTLAIDGSVTALIANLRKNRGK